jgi:hypothetical protein
VKLAIFLKGPLRLGYVRYDQGSAAQTLKLKPKTPPLSDGPEPPDPLPVLPAVSLDLVCFIAVSSGYDPTKLIRVMIRRNSDGSVVRISRPHIHRGTLRFHETFGVGSHPIGPVIESLSHYFVIEGTTINKYSIQGGEE